MAKQNHIKNKLIDRLGRWQRKLRLLTGLVPLRQLPLLTAAASHGPDSERFRDRSQALVSWRDKQLQWWSVAGELRTARGRPLGFEFSFFDRRMQNDFFGPMPVRWVAARAFSAQFSLVDPRNADTKRAHRVWQKGGWLVPVVGPSGFAAEDSFHLELEGWSLYQAGGVSDGPLVLSAFGNGDSLHLELKSLSPLVYHGQSGFEERGANPSDTAFFCSYPDLEVSGRAVIDGALEQVTGVAHLDHEKFSPGERVFSEAWSRLWLSLPGGDAVMIFHSDSGAFGTWVGTDGSTQHLIASDFQLETVEFWTSPKTEARYAVKRKLAIAKLGLVLDLRASVYDQERTFSRAIFSAYWTGMLTYRGQYRGADIEGAGWSVMGGSDQSVRAKFLEFLTKPQTG